MNSVEAAGIEPASSECLTQSRLSAFALAEQVHPRGVVLPARFTLWQTIRAFLFPGPVKQEGGLPGLALLVFKQRERSRGNPRQLLLFEIKVSHTAE